MSRRNSVKVCVRTRPTHHFAQDNIFIDENENTIQINHDHDEAEVLNNKQNSFKFKYDHVFHNSSQAEVYDYLARDTTQGVIDGINGGIISYGQTGSGKSFTMIGDTQNYDHRGIAPRAISQIFSEVNSRIESEFKISCTYMEIYNERIFDLLTDLSNPDHGAEFTITEERDGRGVYVRGLTEIEVTNENEALNLLFSGELARTTATHKLNRRSNRSHSIFTIYTQQRQRSGISEKVIHSKLHLVDLAGSERLKKTMDSFDGSGIVDDVTRKESMCINQSLTYLEQCVVALARKGAGASHVPYRQSKLTNILKDCLGANCNTLLIACIWGEAMHLEETVSTLRLASRMMRVQNETSAVETIDQGALIKKQAKLIKALKQELLMHDALVERTGIGYEPYTPEQQSSIRQMLLKYVDSPEANEEDMLDISSYRQMLEICKQFKTMILATRREVSAAKDDAIAQFSDGYYNNTGGRINSADYSNADGLGPSYNADDGGSHLVGEADVKRTGFALGVASNDARPVSSIEGLTRGSDSKASSIKPASAAQNKKSSLKSPRMDSLPNRAPQTNSSEFVGMTFEGYVRSEGSKLYSEFVNARAKAKDVRTKVKDEGNIVNDFKIQIDQLQGEIAARKSSRIELLRSSGLRPSDTEDIVDEEEFMLMKELREAKRSYKNAYEQLIKDKGSLSQLQEVIDNTKSALNTGYTAWSSKAQKELGDSLHASEMVPRGSMESLTLDGSDASDQLDDHEAFERLEVQRVMAKDPESLAFFHAQKTRRAHMTQNGANIRQIHRNKRLR